ncbi:MULTISPECIES: hypothetical protein [unclassified Streptomyces]|uniref:hypothetical protein n=1 Tax=unclassified Streptomyces TaxID=2593676 RepID=UPI00039B15BF|nr:MULTISPECIES: hypothetical protein [unclassified Streptomyces]MYT28598.1 hypothetical protein [Streptomyces sp. SID8354]
MNSVGPSNPVTESRAPTGPFEEAGENPMPLRQFPSAGHGEPIDERDTGWG